jgi:hypothetical protein
MPSWPVSSCLVEDCGHRDRRQAAGGGGGGGGGEQKKITGPVRVRLRRWARQQARLPMWQAGGEGALPASPPQASAWIRLCCDSGDSGCYDCTCHAASRTCHFTLYALHFAPNGAPRLPPARRRLPAIAVLPARPAVSPAISSQLPFTHHLRAVTLTTYTLAHHRIMLGPALPPAHDASSLAPRHIHHPSSSYPLHLV